MWVVGIDGVNGQPLLLNALDMIGGIVHFTVKIIIGKGATSDGILAVSSTTKLMPFILSSRASASWASLYSNSSR